MESLGLNFDAERFPNELLPKDPAFKEYMRHRSDDKLWLQSEDKEVADEFLNEFLSHSDELVKQEKKKKYAEGEGP